MANATQLNNECARNAGTGKQGLYNNKVHNKLVLFPKLMKISDKMSKGNDCYN